MKDLLALLKPKPKYVLAFWITLIVDMAVFFLGAYAYETIMPQAIDVYRGLTTLQVRYEIRNNDTIPMDSVVKFKNEALIKNY